MISKELLFRECETLGITIDDDCADRLDVYAKMLVDYNNKVNLTAITDPDDIVRKHFADSLVLLKYTALNESTLFADVGTGGGFPGAVLLCARPESHAVLFDSVQKKLTFVRFVLDELGLNGDTVNARAEDCGKNPLYREKFDLVTARAVAQLNVLAEYCLPLVKVGGVFAPMKGRPDTEEQQRGYGAIANLGGKVEKTIPYMLYEAQRYIVLAKKVSQTMPKYPRNAAQIAKKPL